MARRKTSASKNLEATKNGKPNTRICCFCGSSEDNELVFGKFYEHSGIITHYYCLLLSSNMAQQGKDHEGILGFLPDDIYKEIKRGKRLSCSYCKKAGATLGCCNTKCKKIFHYPCGLKNNSLHQFFSEFKSFCLNHRPQQKIDENIKREVQNSTNVLCCICYDEVDNSDSNNTIWAPCCRKNAWFHRHCVQRLAMSAGYFFKCPLCNNQKDFQQEMLQFGIYIPKQDASWELVPNAFEELLFRHNRCDAKECKDPEGRSHSSNDNDKWDLALCRMCGSQGIHLYCGRLKNTNDKWECSDCLAILTKKATNNLEASHVPVNGENQFISMNNRYLTEESDSDVSVGNDNRASTAVKDLNLRPGPRSFKMHQISRIKRQIVSPNTKSTTNNSDLNILSTEAPISGNSSNNSSEILASEKNNSVELSQSNDVICIESEEEQDCQILCTSLKKKKVNKMMRAIPGNKRVIPTSKSVCGHNNYQQFNKNNSKPSRNSTLEIDSSIGEISPKSKSSQDIDLNNSNIALRIVGLKSLSNLSTPDSMINNEFVDNHSPISNPAIGMKRKSLNDSVVCIDDENNLNLELSKRARLNPEKSLNNSVEIIPASGPSGENVFGNDSYNRRINNPDVVRKSKALETSVARRATKTLLTNNMRKSRENNEENSDLDLDFQNHGTRSPQASSLNNSASNSDNDNTKTGYAENPCDHENFSTNSPYANQRSVREFDTTISCCAKTNGEKTLYVGDSTPNVTSAKKICGCNQGTICNRCRVKNTYLDPQTLDFGCKKDDPITLNSNELNSKEPKLQFDARGISSVFDSAIAEAGKRTFENRKLKLIISESCNEAAPVSVLNIQDKPLLSIGTSNQLKDKCNSDLRSEENKTDKISIKISKDSKENLNPKKCSSNEKLLANIDSKSNNQPIDIKINLKDTESEFNITNQVLRRKSRIEYYQATRMYNKKSCDLKK